MVNMRIGWYDVTESPTNNAFGKCECSLIGGGYMSRRILSFQGEQ